MGYTKNLVTTGIYSWIRHPSVIGKLIGVIGLGVLLQTPGFLVAIVPMLLVYSYVTNVHVQERYCVRNFGGSLLALPRRGADVRAALAPCEAVFPGAVHGVKEFWLYMAGLGFMVALVAFFVYVVSPSCG
ncbi:MAG: hypothetical protein M5R36_03390 [Deltaproteobacteria bacterium]|nr:hypothetical protein [Deltaproteobacteria bacterium]